MGVLIVAEAPPATSDYDNWKCYRATSKTGSYSVINGANGQAVTDLSYFDPDGTSSHWYKISYYDVSEADESALSEPLQGLAQTYTTVRKVENLLGLSTLTDSTTPTVQAVIEMINRREDEIDHRTGHAWRLRYSGTTTALNMTPQYEYYDVPFNYEYQTGRPVYLKHRKVRDLDSTEQDAFEIWDGSSWVDWLGTKTEGRGDDFWLDYDRGILYVKARYAVSGPVKLRIKYRYGETDVNRVIEDICTKMVAIDLISGDARMVILPEGSSAMSAQQRAAQFEKEVEKKLEGLKEFQVMSITS